MNKSLLVAGLAALAVGSVFNVLVPNGHGIATGLLGAGVTMAIFILGRVLTKEEGENQ